MDFYMHFAHWTMLAEVAKEKDEDAIDEALDALFTTVRKSFETSEHTGDYTELNYLLKWPTETQARLVKLAPTLLVGSIRSCSLWRRALPDWNATLASTSKELTRRGLNADELLKGLKPLPISR